MKHRQQIITEQRLQCSEKQASDSLHKEQVREIIFLRSASVSSTEAIMLLRVTQKCIYQKENILSDPIFKFDHQKYNKTEKYSIS